ncbi:hypothetical protein Rsub_00661 [Raphidocelis subcapitata]|uniref:YchJ-like middle NTF2-like domain-containing protein n=1 Tax=Raphidocelis subcapitata TaxID=307507 RepID=A0A2V0NLH7_9CHLO|nr:hypothetical protein Rsub_00661 [Raphidocelis subcapitata]|eukprot:GBF87949.1 hypothetical protein Rsub_00661 [Raphidocelis subcapitata]
MALAQHSQWRAAAAGRAVGRAAAGRPLLVRCAAAPAPKGFGKAPAGPLKDGCPCGANKYYRDCCKPFHAGQVASKIEDTLRARFSAVVKKDVDYLMSTFHPEFSSVYFAGSAPGENWDKLRGEMQRTVENYEYGAFKILKVGEGDRPGEKYAQLQYSLLDKRTPDLDENGKKLKRVVIENGRFLQAEDGRWQLADYRLADVPAALVKTAELETKNLKAQAAAKKEAAAAEGA